MPREKKNEVLTGAFTLAGLVLLLVLIFAMGGLDGLFEGRARFSALFRDVQGLRPGDPVYLYGMKIGTVESVRLLSHEEASADAGLIARAPESPTDDGAGGDESPAAGAARALPGRILVTMAIPEGYRDEIHASSEVRVDKSITGTLSVLIREGAQTLPDEPALADGRRVVAADSAEFGDIAEELDGLLAEGRDTLASVRRLVGQIENDGELRRTFDRVGSVAEEMSQKLGPLFEDARTAIDATKTMVSKAREMIEENREAISSTLGSLEEGAAAAKDLLADLRTTPEKLDASLTALRDAGEEAKGLLGENRPGVQSVIEDLGTTIANASNLSQEVKRRPWRLLYRPDADEIAALELYDAAWAYNLGSTELHRSVRLLTERMKHLEGDDEETEEKRATLERALERVHASLERQREAEEVFWERLAATK